MTQNMFNLSVTTVPADGLTAVGVRTSAIRHAFTGAVHTVIMPRPTYYSQRRKDILSKLLKSRNRNTRFYKSVFLTHWGSVTRNCFSWPDHHRSMYLTFHRFGASHSLMNAWSPRNTILWNSYQNTKNTLQVQQSTFENILSKCVAN